MYSDWRCNHIAKPGVAYQIVQANLEVLDGFDKIDLSYALCRFVREVKKLNGEDYPPNTVRELVIMVQMYLHENGIYWKLLDQTEFLSLRNVVDNTMKQRHNDGLGVRQSSNVISLQHENELFEQGVLGEQSPMQLLKTMIYMVGMHCALRGGVEHSKLRRPGFDSQFSIERDERGVERLVYKEDPLQKTNQGGLVCKGSRKVVYVYSASDGRRCPIRLFKKYVSLMPNTSSCKKFYLRCKRKTILNLWYCDQPYGINKIKTAVKDICKEGGLVGHFTNHSLRATCASRMFDQNIPEQIIKEVTGHKSDCVRVYKRTSDHLKEAASKVVSGEIDCKKVKISDDIGSQGFEHVNKTVGDEVKELSYGKMLKNVLKTGGELRKKRFCKLKLKAKHLVSRARRCTIDVNFNMNIVKK